MTAPVAGERRNGVTPKPRPEIEVGVSAFLPFQVPYRDQWEALRTDEVTVSQLAAMRKSDGQASALYRLITLPIRSSLRTATFVPGDNVEGGDAEAEFVEQMFTLPASGGGMTVPFGQVIAQLLLAVFEGFSAFEMVYTSPKTGPLKGKYTLQKLARRPAETLTFILDDRSEWVGLRQRTMYQDKSVDVFIDAANAVYYAVQEEERPYYGKSYFEPAFYHWDKKFKLYIIAHIAAQRAAVGTRVGTVPPNAATTDVTAFKRALAELGVAQWMSIPEGFKVDDLKEGTNFDYLSYINHHNSQMSKSVLAPFFDDQQGSGGDTTLVDFGRQSDAMFLLMLTTIMGEIEEVINQHIIPRFIDWNFGSGKYPMFKFGPLTEERKKALFDMFKILAVAGQSLTVRPELVHEMEKQVGEEFALEIDWDTVETEMAEAKERAELAGVDADGQPLPGQQPPAPTGGPAGQPAPPAQIDPALVPEGFVLSDGQTEILNLSELAADLLAEAYDTVELVRGKTRSGGPKYVRTPEGARVYGVPIGTPITRDMQNKAGTHGSEGRPYGAGVRKAGTESDTQRRRLGGGPGAAPQTPSRKLGGGPGAQAQDPGNINTGVTATVPQRILTNPNQPGAQLLDYGDGTVAIRDAHGHTSPRQKFNVTLFLKFGWKIQPGSGSRGRRT